MAAFYRTAYVLLMIVALMGCAGEQGEPGPQGNSGEQGAKGDTGDKGDPGTGFETAGYLRGTITGHRQDGTPLAEAFDYKYAVANDYFFTDSFWGNTFFQVHRRETPQYADNAVTLDLQVTEAFTPGESLTNLVADVNSIINFSRQLSAGTIFKLQARPEYRSMAYLHAITPEQNLTYNFALSADGFYRAGYDRNLGEFFRTRDGKRIFFENAGTHLDEATGYTYGNFIRALNADGSPAPDEPYANLRYAYNLNYEEVFLHVNGDALFMSDVIPGDELTVSNYTRNTETGVVSFDFVLKINCYGRLNTTGHPLTITGQFNSGQSVYTSVVNRTRD